jgi:hypothetical protein
MTTRKMTMATTVMRIMISLRRSSVAVVAAQMIGRRRASLKLNYWCYQGRCLTQDTGAESSDFVSVPRGPAQPTVSRGTCMPASLRILQYQTRENRVRPLRCCSRVQVVCPRRANADAMVDNSVNRGIARYGALSSVARAHPQCDGLAPSASALTCQCV